MSYEVKEIAGLILQLNYGHITELAKGIGEIIVSADDEPENDVCTAVGGLEKLREAIFYWAENAAS